MLAAAASANYDDDAATEREKAQDDFMTYSHI